MSDGKTPDELKELGNKAFATKDFTSAIEYYSQAIKVEPTNHVFYSNRSASLGGIEKWKEAANDAKECIRLNPTFVKGYYRLASAQMELKEFDAAVATIRQGLAIDTNNAQLTKQMRIVQQQKKVALAKSQAPTVVAGHMDDATRKELQELQIQYSQTSRECNTVHANLQKSHRELKVAEITKNEIQEVPESAKCYRSIGKMFLRSSKTGVIDHLENHVEGLEKSEHDMNKRIEYLTSKMASQRKNIEELVAPGQQQPQAVAN